MPSGFFGSRYSPPAVAFDGSTYLTRGGGLTGAVDTNKMILSFWFKMTGNNGLSSNILTADDGGVPPFSGAYRTSANLMRGVASGLTQMNYVITTATYTTTSNPGWHHFLSSVFTDGGANHSQFYVDGAQVVNTTAATTTIKHTCADWAIGTLVDTLGTDNYHGYLAQLYLNTTEFVDISNAANRAKFYNNGPVYFGSNGSLPTGTQPIIYSNNPAASFGTNLGSGGNFSVTAGSLTDVAGP